MATSKEYIDFVCEQIEGIGDISTKKMFGEYMVYLGGKPVLTVCVTMLKISSPRV